MRTLVFEPGGKAFNFCYLASVLSQMALAKPELRTHANLFTKLESIAVVGNPDRDPVAVVALYDAPVGGTVQLENDEFELLKRLIDSIIGTVNKAMTRDFLATIDWLEALKPDPIVAAPTA